MKKAKFVIMILFTSILLLIVSNVSKAATEYTYKDEAQGIEWAYQLDDSDNVINLRCKTTTKTGKVEIPSTIDGKTVISLNGISNNTNGFNEGAFKDCAGITEVVIPNTVITIGSGTFRNCTGLKSIVIPDSVTSIDSNAFGGCSGMTSVTFSKHLTSIGYSAFSNCTGLKNVELPDSVTTLGEYAFERCSGIKDLTLSNSLSKISRYAFADCSGLVNVKLPESVTTIEYCAFENCGRLQKILIPDSVASIHDGAFLYIDSDFTIYGNDNMTSKQFAEENKIPFDYIANWDKTASGSDVTAPTVESIKVAYESVMSYNYDSDKGMWMIPAGADLAIEVTFSEDVQGSKVPTLTVKFGNGKNISLTNGTISGSKITYIYTIKSTDEGVMTTVDLRGGDIKDTSGNAATLSCPTIEIQYESGKFAYANGTATKPENNSGNSNNGNTSNGGTNSGSSANGNTGSSNNSSSSNSGKNNTSNSGNSNGNDKTIASGKLPQTGVGVGLIATLIATSCLGIFAFLKIRKYRGI